ncbi:MAG: excinuclease ABC subunit UvrC [Salinarimonadaceae bacterium]|nr:MAG: excinuclease ABC subunit UvrC [Salinarimonadaceae bacterium]
MALMSAEPSDTDDHAPGATAGFVIDGDRPPRAAAGEPAGMEVIRQFWTNLPNKPGVYRMIDAQGEVLYVGKAKSLKARVGSYARGHAHSNRIARMIADTVQMEFVTTGTESEALLLEANLIKQLRPRYNVLLRDDKSLPYILVTEDERGPQLTKHRGARTRKGAYFGPFASVWAVNRTMTALQRAFLLRTCSDSYFDNRTRPCLLFQIKRCSGPCTGEIAREDYAALAGEARDFLAGKSSKVKERLAADMQAASDALEFERAARCRDRLAALSAIQSTQGVNTRSVEEADVVAIAEEGGQFCVEVFFFRNWQNWGNRAYFPKADKSLSTEEVLTSFLVQFYSDKPPPRQVLISQEIEEGPVVAAALSARAGSKVEVIAPRRGERRQIVENAQRNAREALGRRLADTASQQRLLDLVADALGLERSPRRVEVYDNSHISGANAVGAMIVAGAAGFMKTHYRTFNMPLDTVNAGDDFAMMREMLRRRFARLLKEAPRAPAPAETDAPVEEPGWQEENADEFPAWPDLVLIDGGQGQVSGVRAILAELGAGDVPVIGVAKGQDREAGRETFFTEGRAPFRLPPRDPALYFIQRLRDEAHRFAIGAHRAKRKREIAKNPLDEIPGVGPTRKRALLHHFGTVKAIRRAGLDDLMRTPGINEATARAVHDFFHEGGG